MLWWCPTVAWVGGGVNVTDSRCRRRERVRRGSRLRRRTSSCGADRSEWGRTAATWAAGRALRAGEERAPCDWRTPPCARRSALDTLTTSLTALYDFTDSRSVHSTRTEPNSSSRTPVRTAALECMWSALAAVHQPAVTGVLLSVDQSRGTVYPWHCDQVTSRRRLSEDISVEQSW